MVSAMTRTTWNQGSGLRTVRISRKVGWQPCLAVREHHRFGVVTVFITADFSNRFSLRASAQHCGLTRQMPLIITKRAYRILDSTRTTYKILRTALCLYRVNLP